jgi:hypothetical protein
VAQAKEIRCPACGVLFGRELDKSLSIKNRDLYRTIEGGKVSGPCRGVRKCGGVGS